MSELKRLGERCGGSVSVSIDGHKDCYDTIKQCIADHNTGRQEDDLEIDADEAKLMIDSGIMVNLHFYPRTPVRFYSLWGDDIDKLVADAHSIIDKEEAQ